MDFERLQELVRQSGKTQQEIADECGLSLATVKKGASRTNIKSRRGYADKDIKYYWQKSAGYRF